MEERKYKESESGGMSEMYDFILDPNLTDLEKFVKYVNIKEGSEFISVDKLKEILEEQI